MVPITRLLTSFCLLLLAISSFGQVSFDNEEDLEKAANGYFEEGKYANAKPLFSQLLSKNALDPNFNYRFGVCILFTEADPLKPLPYIEGGANSAGVNKEALYYLGKAYQFNYRFEDAVIAYQKAKSAGFNQSNVNLDRSIEECLNGKVLYNAQIDFQPAQDKEVMASEFYRPYDFRKLKGKVIPMPPTFKTKYDEKNLFGTVVYTPSNSNILVYASYGEDGANAKDLYRVNRLPNGEWALPQRLPSSINTKYDEDYAFYDNDAQTLYFASKGHNTMGGYDVFSSVYNAESNDWSTPVNLQYPINSPFDDFLYIGDPNGKMAFFTTGRNTAEGKLRVIKTLLHDPEQVEISIVEGTFTDQTDSVYNYMSVTVLDPISNQVVGKYRSHKETGKYLLILPPQNDYTMDVGPKEAEGFKFDLDVPKHDPTKSLNQAITYSAGAEKGTVTLTNYFDATGNPDSISLAESRSLQEVEQNMVAMPDPSALLAARNQEKLNLEAEEATALAEVFAEETKIEAEKAKAEKREQLALQAQEEEKQRQALATKDSIVNALLAKNQEVADALALEKQQHEALLAAKEAKAREQDRIEAERKQAKKDELAMKAESEKLRLEKEVESATIAASKAEAKAEAEAQEQANAQAELEAQKAKTEAESLAKKKAELEKQEIATAAAMAEQERLAQIDREVEMAKAQAMKDSALTEDVSQNLEVVKSEDQSFQALLKEMEEKEAELLLEQELATKLDEGELKPESFTVQEKTKITEEQVAEIVASEVAVAQPEAEKVGEVKKIEEQPSDNETPSESDLFLQTIAKLEAQKAAQEKSIEEENIQIANTKAEKVELQAAKVAASNSALSNGKILTKSAEQSTEAVSTKEAVREELLDVESEIVALKSDANPVEYLAALNEIEAQMAADAKARPDKDYSLQPLENRQHDGIDQQIDPALQKALDADRLALDNHQKIAIQKEQKLRDEMQKEQNLLDNYDQRLNEELAAIENEVELLENELESVSEKADKSPEVESAQLAEENAATEQTLEDVAILESIDEELALIESIEEKGAAPIAEEQREESEVEETLVLKDELAVELELGKVEEEAGQVEETIRVVSETPAIIEETIATETPAAVSPKEETIETPVASEVAESIVPSLDEKLLGEILSEAEEEWIEPVTEEAEGQVKTESVVKPAARVVTIGTIPFLTAAIRNPDKSKPSFKGIEDPSLRRMVKRMRAEDVGRLAVIKNIKNEQIDAAGDEKVIDDIQANLRNQDVLANSSVNSREEYVRPVFDKSHLKEREDVYYKLEFSIKASNVSETILETMTPEMEMTFAMPEFSLRSEFYKTFADVNAGYREYAGRGFTDVKIIPYLKGEPSTLSTVQEIPFID